MKKIGIVGCGTIGSQLAKAVQKRISDRAEISALCDQDQDKAKRLSVSLKNNPPVVPLNDLIKNADFVVEAASAAISADVARKAASAGKDVLIMSVAGLLGNTDVFDIARNAGANIYIPSGALCGLDGLKAARTAGIKSVTLITRKAPKALEGAPYLKENHINVHSIKKETPIFEGSAKDAAKGFPRNVNVAAALSLAAMCPEKTKVKIVVVPESNVNSHEITAEGDFGKFSAKTENLPCPDNPKTSYLAVLSAIATLEGALDNVKVGT